MKMRQKAADDHQMGHKHGLERVPVKLAIALAGAIFLVVRRVFYAWFSIPEWVIAVITTFILFWAGSEFFVRALSGLKRRVANMYTLIALGTSVAYFYSLSVFFFEPFFQKAGIPTHQYFDAIIFITAFVLLGDFFESRATQKASKAIRALLKLQPNFALVLIDPKGPSWKKISIDQLRVGNIVEVKPGEQIPIDGVITKGETSINESMITGESIPVLKKKGNRVIGGTINLTTSIEFEVTKTGKDTILSRIIKLVEHAQSSKAPIQKTVDKIASIFVPIVIVVAFLSLVFWIIFGPTPRMLHGLIAMISVLIIACPCAMGLATPLSIMIAIGRGALKGILVKDAQALEEVGAVEIIVFDKTGTLTAGQLIIQQFEFVSNFKEIGTRIGLKAPPGLTNEKLVLLLGALFEKHSTHPIAQAFVQYVHGIIGNYDQYTKQYTVKNARDVKGLGFEAQVDGLSCIIGSLDVMHDYSISISKNVQEKVERWYQEGNSVSFFAINGELVAFFAISDVIRPEAKEAIALLKQNNIKTIMLTGDNERVARSIAQKLSIDDFFAHVKPDQKAQKIGELKKEGIIVAMVGDGINDAPALAEANVGIAIGSGTDVAIATAPIVLLSNDIKLVPYVVELSKATKRNIYQNLVWAFGYNIILIPVAMGLLYPFFNILISPIMAGGAMVFSSLSVVLNSLRLRTKKLKGFEE